MTTAITPAADPTMLAMIVTLLSPPPSAEPLGDATGDDDVEVGAG